MIYSALDVGSLSKRLSTDTALQKKKELEKKKSDNAEISQIEMGKRARPHFRSSALGAGIQSSPPATELGHESQ